MPSLESSSFSDSHSEFSFGELSVPSVTADSRRSLGNPSLPSSDTTSTSSFEDSTHYPRTAGPSSRKRTLRTAIGSVLSDHDAQSNQGSVKRSRLSLDVPSSSSDETLSDSHDTRAKAPRTAAKPGSSWAKQKALRDSATKQKSSFLPSDAKLAKFRQKILDDDAHAEFDDHNPRWVRCSTCSSTVLMRVLYDLHHWRIHRKSKKCRRHQEGSTHSSSLLQHGFFKRPSSTPAPSSQPAVVSVPCPGLTSDRDVRIRRYLSRSAAAGGGAPSRIRLAAEMFGLRFSELDERQRQAVLRRESQLLRWRNVHALSAVYAVQCEKDVDARIGEDPRPCAKCTGLHRIHVFQAALNRPVPDEQNMKFVPHTHRSSALGKLYLKYKGLRALVDEGDGHSTWLKFAQGAATGVYEKSGIVLGMVEALVKKSERIRMGKSLRNMRYPGAFNDFCNLVASVSPRAYRSFRQHFGGRGMRSIRYVVYF